MPKLSQTFYAGTNKRELRKDLHKELLDRIDYVLFTEFKPPQVEFLDTNWDGRADRYRVTAIYSPRTGQIMLNYVSRKSNGAIEYFGQPKGAAFRDGFGINKNDVLPGSLQHQGKTPDGGAPAKQGGNQQWDASDYMQGILAELHKLSVPPTVTSKVHLESEDVQISLSSTEGDSGLEADGNCPGLPEEILEGLPAWQQREFERHISRFLRNTESAADDGQAVIDDFLGSLEDEGVITSEQTEIMEDFCRQLLNFNA